MARNDEPILDQGDESGGEPYSNDPPLPDRIHRLVSGQSYAVLCTHGEGHAYGSLVAFAFSEDLRAAVFATPRATRKYRLLAEHDRVALVIDNRPDNRDEMMNVEAVTATGRAEEITDEEGRVHGNALLLARHPQFRAFLAAESTALFRVEIFRFLHVVRFQEVRQWIPGTP